MDFNSVFFADWYLKVVFYFAVACKCAWLFENIMFGSNKETHEKQKQKMKKHHWQTRLPTKTKHKSDL